MNRNLILILLFVYSLLFPSCQCEKEVLDPGWISRSVFSGTPRSEAAVFVIGNFAYISGGWDGIKRMNDLWRFDPSMSNGIWLQMASMPDYNDSGKTTGRSSAIGFSIGQEGYIGTGYDGYSFRNDFWQYELASNAWTQKAYFAGGPRFESLGFSIGDFGYLCTGYDGVDSKNDLWRYDPARDKWEQKPPMYGKKRYSAVAFVRRNQAYIVSGTDSSSAVNDFWRYDPSMPDSTTWTQLNHISNYSIEPFDDGYTTIWRWNAAGFSILGDSSISDRAYLTTGEIGSLTSTSWAYNFSSDRWYEIINFLGSPRTGAVGFTVQNRGFIGLGRTNASSISDFWELDPRQ